MSEPAPSQAGPRRRIGRALAIAGGILVAVLLLCGWWVLRLRAGPGARTGELAVAGLSAPVQIYRDSLGIPQVWAASIEDAYFAEGWLHANDRLWQMEQFRRVARGELAELFGEPALASDRFLRTLGMGRAAEQAVPQLCPECRKRVDAYAAGVNAAVAAWRGPLPPEFVLLRARPSVWTAADELAIEKIMAWDLAEYDLGLLLTDAQRRGGDALVDSLLPRWPKGGLTILGDSAPPAPPLGASGRRPTGRVSSAPASGAPALGAPALDAKLLAGARIPDFARALLEQASVVHASNSWVVGGARTKSGKPIVANDMHLSLSVPSIWYLVGLHAPGLDVIGVSIAGSPGVIAGRSGAVAWGYTNAMVDDADLFVERVDSADPTRYVAPGGSQPFVVRQEQIKVRGVAQPMPLTVRETRHGPVISDADERAGKDVIALRWAGLDPSPSAEAIMRMDEARGAEEFIDALRLFRDPHQNVVFADTAGAWGYWMAGRVPLRKSGRPPILPVPGWTDENDWVGDLPFEEHPHALEPARGFVATANNRPTAGPVADVIGNDFQASYRAERITALLDSATSLDAAAVARQQMDVVSLFARKHLQVAVDAFKQAGDTARADSLAAWDGSMGADRREPLLFWQWIEIVRFHVGRDVYAGAPAYFPMSVLDRMLDDGQVGAATTTSVVKEAVADASHYRWGDMHPLQLDHPLQNVQIVGGALGFGHAPVPIGGDPYTIAAADHSGRNVPFVVKNGPSERFVVDLGDPAAGGFILPGGESGFPRSAHAFDQLDAWLQGRLAPMPLDRKAVEAAGVSSLRLIPGPK